MTFLYFVLSNRTINSALSTIQNTPFVTHPPQLDVILQHAMHGISDIFSLEILLLFRLTAHPEQVYSFSQKRILSLLGIKNPSRCTFYIRRDHFYCSVFLQTCSKVTRKSSDRTSTMITIISWWSRSSLCSSRNTASHSCR